MDSNLYTVLTGDVVNSAEVEDYGKSLDEVFSQFEKDYQDNLPLGVDRYSGDQFQILLSSCQSSLRGSLYIFTKLASLKTSVPVRISIAIGGIDALPEERVSLGEGEAFRLSGSNLEGMRNYQRITFEGSEDIVDSGDNRLIGGSMDLLSALLLELSPAQAEVIWYKLRGYTQNEIAGATDRKQQTVSDISIAGSWRNIEGFLAVYERQFAGE